MAAKVKLLKAMNHLFPLPAHPFNLQNEGIQSYAQWQYERGAETIKFYLENTTQAEMFQDKQVLDIGCGAAGKTLYYASLGAKKVTGIDVVSHYEQEANQLAAEKGLTDRFQFVLGDAANLPFEENTFDTIIMNDAMEHVDQPLAVLQSCYRVLRPKGRIYINFPPYYHPFGAHLSDAIGFPWVHMFFDEATLIQVYKDQVKALPDGESRIHFRIGVNPQGKEYFSYINHMTIKRFQGILKETPYQLGYYKEVPLRSFFGPAAKLPLLKEALVKMVVVILEK